MLRVLEAYGRLNTVVSK